MVDRDELIKRQRALARFGEFVLRCDDLHGILTEGCRLIADALGTDLAKVLEIERRQDTALVIAGVGWNSGVVGHARISLGERSSEAYAIETARPVVSRDIAREERFAFPAFMKEHGVVAMINVPILLPGGEAFGVLQVDAREPREFGEEDVEFLRTYAAILGPVIDRLRQAGELTRSNEHFRLIVESARDYAILLADADGVVTAWLPGAAEVFGWTAQEMVGRSAEVIFTPEDREAGVPRQEMEQASREGSAPDVRWHLCKDGRRVFIDGRTVALRHRNGSLRGFLKIGQDTTGRRRDEERQAVLLAELQHRVRNVLAMVRALVGRGRDTGSVAEFRAALDGRIAALARTQTLLTRHADDDGVDLEHLVRDEVTAQMDEAGRAALAGPAVTLSPKAAEVLSLAIHELATNATKHGAFAAKAGRVAVNWRVEARPPGPWLHLAWQESGVALEPGAPERMGFGTELITRRVPYELGGEGRIAFGPGGLRCEIAFPLLDGGSTLQTDAPVRPRGGGEA